MTVSIQLNPKELLLIHLAVMEGVSLPLTARTRAGRESGEVALPRQRPQD